VIGIEGPVTYRSVTEGKVVKHYSSAKLVGITGNVYTLEPLTGGRHLHGNGSLIFTVYVVMHADSIGCIVKNYTDRYIEPSGILFANVGDTGYILAEELNGIIIAEKLKGGGRIRFILALFNNELEDVSDNLFVTPSRALNEGKGEVLIHISVELEGKEANGRIAHIKSGEAVTLLRDPKLKLRRTLTVGFFYFYERIILITIFINVDLRHISSLACDILFSIVAAYDVINGNHIIVMATVVVVILILEAKGAVAGGAGILRNSAISGERYAVKKLLTNGVAASSLTGRGSHTGSVSHIVTERLTALLSLTANTAGSRIGTGRI
jgi:hypothetical protein